MHTIYALIPPGSADTTHFQLRRGSYYILPRDSDKSISGELLNIPFKEWYELKAYENQLTMLTWNEDDTYSHKVRLLIGILPKKTMEMEEEIIKDLRTFIRLFRRRN